MKYGKGFNTHQYHQRHASIQGELLEKTQFLPIARIIHDNEIETVVDVGCGTGILKQYLRDEMEYIGIDRSKEMLNYCKIRGLNAFEVDIEREEIPKLSSNLKLCIVCNGTFEYFDVIKINNFLHRNKNILDKSSVIVFTVYNSSAWFGPSKSNNDICANNLDEIVEILHNVKLYDVKIEPVAIIPNRFILNVLGLIRKLASTAISTKLSKNVINTLSVLNSKATHSIISKSTIVRITAKKC